MSNTEEDTPVRTGGGDDGKSSLIDGDRRFKDDIAFDALGTIDEAQVSLGVCRSLLPSRGGKYKKLNEDLSWIQRRLLVAGGVIASPAGSPLLEAMDTIDDEDLSALERVFARWREKTDIEPRFFIGGDTRLGAEFDRARTVVRRAERAVVRVVRERGGQEHILVSKFLNMLSDFGFVLARWADSQKET
ncbi:MAG: ATP:cob(I)alamin adenosyltransferase [Alkalispirochaeta sp.]